jgi:hypothetical protein
MEPVFSAVRDGNDRKELIFQCHALQRVAE